MYIYKFNIFIINKFNNLQISKETEHGKKKILQSLKKDLTEGKEIQQEMWYCSSFPSMNDHKGHSVATQVNIYCQWTCY